MSAAATRTYLFSDVEGSTRLWERHSEAMQGALARHDAILRAAVEGCGGTVVKTTGDGLMAVFGSPASGVRASDAMHESLDRLVSRGSEHGASAGLRALRLQVALARGEVGEMAGDCSGDAVNVAARLLDHAGDNETLVTAEVLSGLSATQQKRFRSLDRMHLRGRVEPVSVHLLTGDGRGSDSVATQFGDVAPPSEPEGIRLIWLDLNRVYAGPHLPVVLGRSAQATYCIDDSRVSRSHARIDWHGGTFQLTDLSYNGTYVRFANEEEVVSLRRATCTLHGSGVIGLGGSPTDPACPTVRFEVLSSMDTVPHQPS